MPSLLKSRGGVGVDQDESTARARRRRDRSRALHPAGRRTPSRRRPPLGTPHQQHRPHQRRHRRLSGRDLPRQPPQHRYRTRRPYHPRPAPVAHLRSLGGDAGGASHYIPAYLGISRHISDPFFCSRAPKAETASITGDFDKLRGMASQLQGEHGQINDAAFDPGGRCGDDRGGEGRLA